jgi:omega-amidase
VKIALISMDQRWEDPAANLDRCRELTAEAAALGSELVVFPEMTLTGFTMHATAFAESPDESPTLRAFRELAADAGVAIAFGVVLHGHERPRNTLVVVDATGAEVARYAKMHPFSLAGESEHFEAGDEVVSARVAGIDIGLSVCYDLRFPLLYSALAPEVAALLVIANWPAPRIAHWHALLRARAIESLCYAIGVNRTGSDANGHEYPPSSAVYGPSGEALEPLSSAGEVEVYEIDAQLVARYRERFPFLLDRREVPVRGAPR